MKIYFNQEKLTHWIYALLTFKYVSLMFRGALPFTLPEVHRQYDTIGVSMRYASRWFLETFPDHYTFTQKYLLPAVLNTKDHFGVVTMEFPLLNLLAAPFFFFEHESGRVFGYMWVMTVVFSLTIFNAYRWKKQRLLGLNAYPAFLLLPLFSLGLYWSSKFMPDYLSLLLLCLGISFMWEASHSIKNFFLSVFICTLGVLMKPTSITVFGLYLANEKIYQKLGRLFKREVKKGDIISLLLVSLGIILPTLISYFYFTEVKGWISKYQDIEDRFYITLIPIERSFKEIIHYYLHYLKLWGQVIFFLGSVFIILGILLFKSIQIKRYSFHFIWGIIFLQTVFIALLAGFQAYTHMYYFIGVTPLCCILYTSSFKHTRSKILKAILILGLVITVYERVGMELKNYMQPWREKDTIYEECSQLIAQNKYFPWDQAYIFRSPKENFPKLGVCFGERQGSEKAEFGFHYRRDPLPLGCKIIDKTKNLALLRCLNQR